MATDKVQERDVGGKRDRRIAGKLGLLPTCAPRNFSPDWNLLPKAENSHELIIIADILPAGQTVHGFGRDGSGELYAMATDTPPNGNGGVVYKLFSVRLTARFSGNLVDLSWPVAGARLQAQVNPPGVGLTKNWLDVPGSTVTNRVVIPINQANGTAFFRLAFQ